MKKLRRIVAALAHSSRLEDMKLQAGLRLHSLKGKLSGHYAVPVSGNWRVTFRFDESGTPVDVDYCDYH